MSRRQLLLHGLPAGALAVAVPGSMLATPLMVGASRLGSAPHAANLTLTRATFAPHQNTAFEVHSGEFDTVVFTLTEVTDLPHATPHSPDRFSLIFRGQHSPAFRQGTYRFDHPALGSFPLFVVPVGRAGRVASYQAIVNTLV